MALLEPVYEIVDPDLYERGGMPHDRFRAMRERAPVYRHHGHPDFWAVTRYEDVVHVSRHPELFSSHERLALFPEVEPEARALQQMMMLNQDPPDHTRKRSIVNRGFTPRAINALTDHIRDICQDLVGEAAGRARAGEEIDFVHEIAAPLPLYVICELLGAPVEDRDKIFDWSNKLIGGDDPELQSDPEVGAQAATELYSYANELAARRREDPRDDIVTRLLRPGPDGSELSGNEFELFILLLSVAGNETTRNAASGGMLALFEHPDQWARLLADPSLLPRAVDEIVRWVTPVNMFRRTAMQDTELGGQEIAAGDKVVVFYGSANRDGEVFTDPDTFDVGRDPNPHIGFGGGGPHFCLGAHLARLELTVLFQTLLDTMSTIKLTGNVRRLRSSFINGIKEMPVRLEPHSHG
ncbi:cytochrome P450 [Actinomadura craniellae]|uniref:Cytochrome P450 n=1 Tax=Actinomadura craniellae TaxID=2231787 RepID=A0A365H2Z0_9ACTN|nr:cytochrome P450 [Actinomadura craniellae]RAY13461.1 cytochrome P450 [Actinomadura craniellae]